MGNTPLTPSGDYVDWSLGASVAWRNLTFGVAYVDTNLSAAEAALAARPATSSTAPSSPR